MLSPDLLLLLHIYCATYKVEPAMPLAIMKLESNFKCGPLGKKGTFIGPGGLHKDYRKKFKIDDPNENIRVTVASFEGVVGEQAFIERVKSYNPEWRKNNYLRDLLKAYRAYQAAPDQFSLRRRP